MRGFIVRCMETVGTKSEHAESLAELLITADYRGHYSHGLNRLGILNVICVLKTTNISDIYINLNDPS